MPLLPGAILEEADQVNHQQGDVVAEGWGLQSLRVERTTYSPERLTSNKKLFESMAIPPNDMTQFASSLPVDTHMFETSLDLHQQMALYGVTHVRDFESSKTSEAADTLASPFASMMRRPRGTPTLRDSPARQTAVSFMLEKISSSKGPPSEVDSQTQPKKSKSMHNRLQGKVKRMMAMKEATAWIRMKKQVCSIAFAVWCWWMPFVFTSPI